ncbi:hypothetical protein OGATHE_003017 [Ogataea polymorpha]|uniref:Uncharacterized protein n=1 Tax=Ogataea polymorpha TaxID=460523 RepID=A0A9P8T949_9ASCO|nr:hypothetical protein OGATHE_003017 [Ogataea polymorpha]
MVRSPTSSHILLTKTTAIHAAVASPIQLEATRQPNAIELPKSAATLRFLLGLASRVLVMAMARLKKNSVCEIPVASLDSCTNELSKATKRAPESAIL